MKRTLAALAVAAVMVWYGGTANASPAASGCDSGLAHDCINADAPAIHLDAVTPEGINHTGNDIDGWYTVVIWKGTPGGSGVASYTLLQSPLKTLPYDNKLHGITYCNKVGGVCQGWQLHDGWWVCGGMIRYSNLSWLGSNGSNGACVELKA